MTTTMENKTEITLFLMSEPTSFESGNPGAGSIEDLKIDSISFGAAADSDFDEQLVPYIASVIVNSGTPVPKWEKRVLQVSGITVTCNDDMLAVLRRIMGKKEVVAVSYKKASGTVVQFDAVINEEGG